MIDTNFGTMFENRSAFEQRNAQPAPMASMGPMGSIPAEQPQAPPQSMVGNFMASVGLAPSAMASMASTVDQNSSMLQQRATNPMESTRNSEADRPGFMSTIMSPAAPAHSPEMHNVREDPFMSRAGNVGSLGAGAPAYGEPEGIMASIMGMGGSLPASMMGSNNGSVASMTSMVDYSENRSPNRTPTGSMNGKAQPSAMSSIMSSIGFSMEPDTKAGTVPVLHARARMH